MGSSNLYRLTENNSIIQHPYIISRKDIAEHIGLHYTTVSRAIKRIEREGKK